MAHLLRFRPSPQTAASRLAAIQVLATLARDEDDFGSVTTALRLLGVSEQELDSALLGYDLSGTDRSRTAVRSDRSSNGSGGFPGARPTPRRAGLSAPRAS